MHLEVNIHSGIISQLRRCEEYFFKDRFIIQSVIILNNAPPHSILYRCNSRNIFIHYNEGTSSKHFNVTFVEESENIIYT